MSDDLKDYIREVPDFPKPGIGFKDISPLLKPAVAGVQMAGSLTVHHDEKPSTSPLLNAFLLLAFAWMGMTALVSMNADAGPSEPLRFNIE